MNTAATPRHQPWNKEKLVGQKAPLRLRDRTSICSLPRHTPFRTLLITANGLANAFDHRSK